MNASLFALISLLLLVGCASNQPNPAPWEGKITNQTCDAVNRCPEGLECYSFPDLGLRCAQSNPCSYYCPGKECLVLESYPEQIRCR